MPKLTLCRLRSALLVGVSLLSLAGNAAQATDGWDPFKQKDEARPRRPAAAKQQDVPSPPPSLPPMEGVGAAPWRGPQGGSPVGPEFTPPGPPPREAGRQPLDRDGPRTPTVVPAETERTVERSELQPIATTDATGRPSELWQGVDARNVHGLVTRLDIPPRSPAVHGLWKRLWTTEGGPAGNAADRDRFEALRIEALYRSGLIKELLERLDAEKAGTAGGDPLRAALATRARVGAGDTQRGCADARGLARQTGIEGAIRGEMLLLGGYCAAAGGDQAATGLAVELIRAETIDAPLQLAALDAVANGQPMKPVLPKRLTLMEYRFLALAKSIDYAAALERAEPALLVTLATDPAIEHAPARRVQAAELAARINALDADRLAEIYRAQTFAAADIAEPLQAKVDPSQRRALLFKAVEAERTPIKRARLARALLDEARRAGLYLPTAMMLGAPLQALQPVPEIGWFAETAIEVHIAAGRYDAARRWISASTAGDRADPLQHWLVLADLADPKAPGPRGASLVHAEQLAVRGRLAPDLMHRLATVLDALDYQIPIPLWEAASRTPQPKTGHLPETGVLSSLQDASKKKEFARTVLLAISALGSDGADRAHMIALGDAIRALKRAGLEGDARRLALEAVFAGWPRTASQ